MILKIFFQSTKQQEKEFKVKMEPCITTPREQYDPTYDPKDLNTDTSIASFHLSLDCFPNGETFREDIEVSNYVNYEADSVLQIPKACNCGNCTCSHSLDGDCSQGCPPSCDSVIENIADLIDDLSEFQAFPADLDILSQSNTDNIMYFCSKHAENLDPTSNCTTTHDTFSDSNNEEDNNISSGVSLEDSNKCCLIIDLNSLKQLKN